MTSPVGSGHVTTVTGGNVTDDRERYYVQYMQEEHPLLKRFYYAYIRWGRDWQTKRSPLTFIKLFWGVLLYSVFSLPLYLAFSQMTHSYNNLQRMKKQIATKQQAAQTTENLLDRVAALEAQVKQLTAKLEGSGEDEHDD